MKNWLETWRMLLCNAISIVYIFMHKMHFIRCFRHLCFMCTHILYVVGLSVTLPLFVDNEISKEPSFIVMWFDTLTMNFIFICISLWCGRSTIGIIVNWMKYSYFWYAIKEQLEIISNAILMKVKPEKIPNSNIDK